MARAGSSFAFPLGLALVTLCYTAALGQHNTSRQAAPRRAPLRLSKVFQAKTIQLPHGTTSKYALYIPPQYADDATHRWPVILFLHGSQECGRDGVRQTHVGLPRYILGHYKQFPFITIMPQAHTLWFRGEDAIAVWAILNAVLKEYRTDPDRVFITGLSMGGFATWEMAMSRPDIFAAAVPVCGRGEKRFVSNIRHLPVWAFHGKIDKNVPVTGSRLPIAELRRLGAKPRYTEFPNLPHVCWDQAYSSKSLWRWLLKQRRQPPPRVIDFTMPGTYSHIWWLSIAAEKGLEQPAHIRAEVIEKEGLKRIVLESKGIIAWTITSNRQPLIPGDEIELIWNGKQMGKGPFSGQISYLPKASPPSRPASQPAIHSTDHR